MGLLYLLKLEFGLFHLLLVLRGLLLEGLEDAHILGENVFLASLQILQHTFLLFFPFFRKNEVEVHGLLLKLLKFFLLLVQVFGSVEAEPFFGEKVDHDDRIVLFF